MAKSVHLIKHRGGIWKVGRKSSLFYGQKFIIWSNSTLKTSEHSHLQTAGWSFSLFDAKAYTHNHTHSTNCKNTHCLHAAHILPPGSCGWRSSMWCTLCSLPMCGWYWAPAPSSLMHRSDGRLALRHSRAGDSQNMNTMQLLCNFCISVSLELSHLCGWSRRCTQDKALKPADPLCSAASRWCRPTLGYSHLLHR